MNQLHGIALALLVTVSACGTKKAEAPPAEATPTAAKPSEPKPAVPTDEELAAIDKKVEDDPAAFGNAEERSGTAPAQVVETRKAPKPVDVSKRKRNKDYFAVFLYVGEDKSKTEAAIKLLEDEGYKKNIDFSTESTGAYNEQTELEELMKVPNLSKTVHVLFTSSDEAQRFAATHAFVAIRKVTEMAPD